MWYDADIDAQMTRTKKRPLPRGVMEPRAALTFGFLLSVVSVWMLGLATNYVAAGLLAFTIFFYVVIVIGGAPGALPPMIGYAAVTGTVTIDSTILFLIIFIWTPPPCGYSDDAKCCGSEVDAKSNFWVFGGTGGHRSRACLYGPWRLGLCFWRFPFECGLPGFGI